MATLTILLAGLVALPAQRLEDDPEPPKPGPIGVRLVAKKAKYTLDFSGAKKQDYVMMARAGKIQPPKVELELVLTNHTKDTIRIRSVGSTNRLTLTLKGNGAVEADSTEISVRVPIQYTLLKPGEKLTIPIDRLSDRMSATKKGNGGKNHYWTEPGKYTLTASFYTSVTGELGAKLAKSGLQTLTSKPITIEVEK